MLKILEMKLFNISKLHIIINNNVFMTRIMLNWGFSVALIGY